MTYGGHVKSTCLLLFLLLDSRCSVIWGSQVAMIRGINLLPQLNLGGHVARVRYKLWLF